MNTKSFEIGKKYYFFTVAYHYIGVIQSKDKDTIVLKPGSLLVLDAGSKNNACSRIVEGLKQPKVCEKFHTEIIICSQSLTAALTFPEKD